MGRQSKTWKPKTRYVARAQVRESAAPRLARGYWEALIQDLLDLPDEQGVELIFPLGSAMSGYRSSFKTAATKLGVHIHVVERFPALYAWVTGRTERFGQQPKKRYIECRVCREPIEQNPKAKRQYVHAGDGNVKSECQQIWRISRERNVSIEEAKEIYQARKRRRPRSRRGRPKQSNELPEQ